MPYRKMGERELRLKSIVIGAALAAFLVPVSASKSIAPPPDMLVQTVPFQLGCFETYQRMESYLKEVWGESPRHYMTFRADGGTDGWIFTNDDNTTISLVIRKFFPADGGEVACIIWSGESPDGLALIPQ